MPRDLTKLKKEKKQKKETSTLNTPTSHAQEENYKVITQEELIRTQLDVVIQNQQTIFHLLEKHSKALGVKLEDIKEDPKQD